MGTQSMAKVLVVDDVPQNLAAMSALLGGDGVEVLTAASGPEALERLLAHDVALALLDVQMPGMDGYALAELMRGSQRTREVPIVFVTAFLPDEQRRFRGYEAGAVDVLYKPVDPHLLRSKVRVFVELHRQREAVRSRMAELERVARLNALMLGALSHDIRTPLAALTLNAELIVRRAELPALQQAGARLKAATAMLGRQVDHLVNLATLPALELRPQPQPLDLGELVWQRIAALPALAGEPGEAFTLQPVGDLALRADPALLTRAIDHLLLLATAHRGEGVVRVELDGQSRRALVLRLAMAALLPEAMQHYLFGSNEARPGVAPARVGPGLDAAERIARAHGGSLIGRSSAREGTLFELLLPRGEG